MRFTLKIDNYDNDAMTEIPYSETARILRDAARRIENGVTSGSIRDTNGNTVGSFEFREED